MRQSLRIQYVSRNLREMQFDGPRFEGSPRLDFERPPEMDWTKQGKLTPVKDQGRSLGRAVLAAVLYQSRRHSLLPQSWRCEMASRVGIESF